MRKEVTLQWKCFVWDLILDACGKWKSGSGEGLGESELYSCFVARQAGAGCWCISWVKTRGSLQEERELSRRLQVRRSQGRDNGERSGRECLVECNYSAIFWKRKQCSLLPWWEFRARLCNSTRRLDIGTSREDSVCHCCVLRWPSLSPWHHC